MLKQFEVITINSKRLLCIVQTDYWDWYIGFRKIIRELK